MAKFSRHELANLLVSALQNAEDTPPMTEEAFEADVQEKCIEIWQQDQRKEIEQVPTLKSIPRLFNKRDFAPNSIAERTRREARIRMLTKHQSLLLEQEHLELAQQLLLQHALSTDEGNRTPHEAPFGMEAPRNWAGSASDARINYDGYCQVREMLPAKMAHFLQPSVFLHFPRDEQGAVSVLPIYQYMYVCDALLRKRITLGWYDFTGAGFLRESDLDNFVQDEIANSPILSQLEKSFETYYVCTAVRMFLFFLDPGTPTLLDLLVRKYKN